jgi:general secretion pathway protein L
MPTLIIYLNATPEFDYVLQRDDLQTVKHGRAAAALLPVAARGTEVVVVVPAHALSWHTVKLPDKVASGLLAARADPLRIRAVLGGAMEEQLLDEADNLHFAAFPGPVGGNALWVALCGRSWLRNGLAALEAAGYGVARIVAECEPVMADATALAFFADASGRTQLCLCTASGVTVLPLGEAAVSLVKSQAALEMWAQPSMMGEVETLFGVPVQAQTLQQSMLRAAQSTRNLAQLEFSPSKRGRALKRLGGAWQSVRHAPQWRPVRWGLLALLVSQVVALNAAAYRQQTLLAQKRAAIESVLRETFPNVPVVVDAPVQMQREVGALAQSRGAADVDVPRLLTAVSAAGGNTKVFTSLDLNASELRLKSGSLSDADAGALTSAIGAQGWQVRIQGDQLVLQRKETN